SGSCRSRRRATSSRHALMESSASTRVMALDYRHESGESERGRREAASCLGYLKEPGLKADPLCSRGSLDVNHGIQLRLACLVGIALLAAACSSENRYAGPVPRTIEAFVPPGAEV